MKSTLWCHPEVVLTGASVPRWGRPWVPVAGWRRQPCGKQRTRGRKPLSVATPGLPWWPCPPPPGWTGGAGEGARGSLDSWAGLGGTNTNSGGSGPWYPALQVCPVPFGALPAPSSLLPPAPSHPVQAGLRGPLPLPQTLPHGDPLTHWGGAFVPSTPCLPCPPPSLFPCSKPAPPVKGRPAHPSLPSPARLLVPPRCPCPPFACLSLPHLLAHPAA